MSPNHFVLSARDGGQKLADRPLPRAEGSGHLPQLAIDTSQRFQSHLGFGGAFTESAATVWQGLPEPAREQLLRDYFDPVHGHGYTLCRVHINSCDFALGHYAHADADGDLRSPASASSATGRPCCPSSVPRNASPGARYKLLASPWSPPAWMKTNGRMDRRRQLRPECRAAWAQCYVRFIRAYADEGVPIWGVSVQNEPMAQQRWDSCLYTAEEERDFVRDHLGPALREAGLGHVKIVDLGSQPRPDVRARARDLRRPAGRGLRLGHGLPLVRRRELRQRAAGARCLARQAPAVHRGLPGRRAHMSALGRWASATRATSSTT